MGQSRTGKPVISYPYNTIENPELVDVIDTDGADYTVLTEGAPYPDAVKYPNHKLIFQDPIDNRYLRRTYLNIDQVTWTELESIGVVYPELFAGFEFIDPIGSAWIFKAARARTVLAQSVYTLSIGETVVSQSALWNPDLRSWRLWANFSASNVITDTFTYSGSINGVSFSTVVPASVPSLTQYQALLVAHTYVLYQFESKRWKENIYANKWLYIPLL